MNNSFSLQQISRPGNVDSNFKSRQYKLSPMADFMRIKNENPKLKQSEIANQLGYSTSTLRRYKHYTKMLSPYRIQSINMTKRRKKTSNTNLNNDSHR